MLDELWLARAAHLAQVRRGCGAVVVQGGRKLAEASARSSARAIREATTEAGRSARAATLYLAPGTSELDRGELAAIVDGGFARVLIDAGPTSRSALETLARRLRALGVDTDLTADP
jgi:hypothetical protein